MKTDHVIEFGRRPTATLTSIILTLLASSVLAQAEDMRVGLAAPLSGTFAPLGNQLAEGARVAATAKGAELVIFDDRCDAEGGKEAAEQFVKENVRIAAGFLCPEALEAALPVLAAGNIPVVTSGVSEPTLTERRAAAPMAVFRLATGLDKETQATGSFLGSLWRAQAFAIIGDGTIEGRERAVVVAAPADRPPLARLHGAYRATAIAEWFRDQGLNVLLLMDSLTRFAQAQREIGLSVGEPPTTRGYPPSVFAKLPALVERAGNGAKGRGSITAFYTMLTEGDDPQDPIADAARAILDGHILLSRRVADSGLYPAIDVESSVSRVVQDIADDAWRLRIRKLKRLVAAYSANRDLIAIGAYQRGNDAATDEALERWPEILEFLGQDVSLAADLPHSLAALKRLVESENVP